MKPGCPARPAHGGAEREGIRDLMELSLTRTTGTTGLGLVGMFLITLAVIRLVEALRAAG